MPNYERGNYLIAKYKHVFFYVGCCIYMVSRINVHLEKRKLFNGRIKTGFLMYDIYGVKKKCLIMKGELFYTPKVTRFLMLYI